MAEEQHDLSPPRVAVLGFWESIQQRREVSDREKAAIDANAVGRRQQRNRNRCKALFLGQVIALILASVNMTSFTLENQFQVEAPTFQLFLMYCFLSLHLLLRPTTTTTTTDHHNPPRMTSSYRMPLFGFRLLLPWYLYFFFSCLDVGAGIILLVSLQYTSLTSVTLLGSLTIPSTMLFSKFLLGKSFRPHHFGGVCLCMIGGCLTLWSDSSAYSDAGTPTSSAQVGNGLRSINAGDIMAITAALVYGFGDAVSEYAIKHIDRMEFLGMMGFFGAFLTGIQWPFWERDVLYNLFFNNNNNNNANTGAALLLMGSYVGLLLLYYVTEAAFLVKSDATLLNLSLQAQNLWAILFTVVTSSSSSSSSAAPPWLFYLAVIFVFAGVAAYEVMGPSSDPVVPQIVNMMTTTTTQNNNTIHPTENPINMEEGDHKDDAMAHGFETSTMRNQSGAKYNSIQQIEII
jgi:solute carrier family 35, member F1/2